MPKYNTLFPSEHAYRIATVLCTCSKNGISEMLIPDIAYKAMVKYSTALYWINIFDNCGFIYITRYKNRENEICCNNRHVIVHLTEKKKLFRLYNYMWLQKWESEFCANIGTNNLTLVEKVA